MHPENACKRASYQRRRANGLCGKCGGAALPSFSRCADCRQLDREESRLSRLHALEHGLCGACKRRELVPGRKACAECLERGRVRRRVGYVAGPRQYSSRTSAVRRMVGGVLRKLCRPCGRWLEEKDFHRASNQADGLQPRCKLCQLDDSRIRRARLKDLAKARECAQAASRAVGMAPL